MRAPRDVPAAQPGALYPSQGHLPGFLERCFTQITQIHQHYLQPFAPLAQGGDPWTPGGALPAQDVLGFSDSLPREWHQSMDLGFFLIDKLNILFGMWIWVVFYARSSSLKIRPAVQIFLLFRTVFK